MSAPHPGASVLFRRNVSFIRPDIKIALKMCGPIPGQP